VEEPDPEAPGRVEEPASDSATAGNPCAGVGCGDMGALADADLESPADFDPVGGGCGDSAESDEDDSESGEECPADRCTCSKSRMYCWIRRLARVVGSFKICAIAETVGRGPFSASCLEQRIGWSKKSAIAMQKKKKGNDCPRGFKINLATKTHTFN
jgi:hypothetical protein